MDGIKNIAICGDVGTGKGTLAKNLQKKLGWEILSTGEFFRRYHKEHNLPMVDTLDIPEELDRKVDMGFQERMLSEKDHIFESHLAGWLSKDFPTTFKILLTCDKQEAMRRISKREGITPEEAEQTSWKRSRLLDQKFKRLYDVDNCYNPEYFDLVIDTTNITPEEVLNVVLKNIQDKIK